MDNHLLKDGNSTQKMATVPNKLSLINLEGGCSESSS